jgi:hypothetical protein
MSERAWQPPERSPATAPESRTDARGPAQVLLALQRTAGNAAVTALVQRARIQRRPLVESDYASLSDLRKEISIVQTPSHYIYVPKADAMVKVPAKVEVSYPKSGFAGVNVLSEATVGQAELTKAKSGGFTDKAALGLAHPELVWHKGALEGVEKLSYVKKNVSGSAIGKVSEAMAANITSRPPRPNTKTRTDEAIKNMLLHVFGQAIITTIYGRAAADLVGDIHERDQPALIVGGFTAAEERQAIDNYCDLINNLHGQTWGAELSTRLGVDDDTVWTPTITALYASELQKLIAAEMGWKMTPFTAKNPVIVKFTDLLNEVTGHGVPAPAAVPAAKTP